MLPKSDLLPTAGLIFHQKRLLLVLVHQGDLQVGERDGFRENYRIILVIGEVTGEVPLEARPVIRSLAFSHRNSPG